MGTTDRQGGLPDALWTDPRVQAYEQEGSFGYLHHSIRAKLWADDTLVTIATESGYDHDALVGLLISRVGRLAGDEMTHPDAAGRLRRYLGSRSTRTECAISAHAYAEEIRERELEGGKAR